MLQETVIPLVRFSSFWGKLIYWFREKNLTVKIPKLWLITLKLVINKYFNKKPCISSSGWPVFSVKLHSNWLSELNFPSSSSISLFCCPLPCPTNPHTCHLPGLWALPQLVYNPHFSTKLKYERDFHHDLRCSCYCSPAHRRLQCKKETFF